MADPKDNLKVYICPGADPADVDGWSAFKVDITEYVQEPVSVEHGLRDESAEVQATKCTLVVSNDDGRFSPANRLGPWYGLLGRNTPLIMEWDDTNVRFGGTVSEWPTRWLGIVDNSRVPVRADGALRRHRQNSPPLRSAFYREITRRDRPGLVAYWPFEDGDTATSIASGIAEHPPMVFTGQPTLATFSDFLASEPLPTMGNGRFQGVVPTYTVTDYTVVRAFVNIPEGGTTSGQELVMAQTTGTASRWSVIYTTDSGGSLRLLVTDVDGATLEDSGAIAFAVDGFQFSMALDVIQAAGDIVWRLLVFKILPDGTSESTQWTDFFLGQTVGRVARIFVARGGGLGDVAIGHVAVGNDMDLFTDTADALLAWRGETAADRFERLLAEQGESSTVIGTAASTEAMGAQRPAALLDLLKECEATDRGILHEVDGVLAYRTRESLYNQTPAMVIDWCELRGMPEPTDDDQRIVNEATATRRNGSSATYADPAHIARHGLYTDSVAVNTQTDDALPDIASWMVHVGTVDEMRWPVIRIRPSADPDLIAPFLALRVGDRITVANSFPQLPGVDIDLLVLGWTETFTSHQWDVQLNCAPASPWIVAVLEDDVLGRLDTSGSETVGSFVAGTGTSLSVAITTGPLWTTDGDMLPFEIAVAGVVLNVTAISGASSPQTFTVDATPVNGIAKTIPDGSAVRLAHPMRLAL